MKIKYQNGNTDNLNLLKQVSPSELKNHVVQSDEEFKELLKKIYCKQMYKITV